MAEIQKFKKVVLNGPSLPLKQTWRVAILPESISADAGDPLEAPEPDFSEIKHLVSNKPLDFDPRKSQKGP